MSYFYRGIPFAGTKVLQLLNWKIQQAVGEILLDPFIMVVIGSVHVIREEGKIEWKIGNFLRLGGYEDYYSPNFDLSGVSGYLHIYLRSQEQYEPFEYADIHLLLGSMPGHCANVAATLSLKTVHGENDLEKTLVITETWTGFSIHEFISRSDLIERQSELLPSGAVTVICTLNGCNLNFDRNTVSDDVQISSVSTKRQFLETTQTEGATGGDKCQLPAANPYKKLRVDLKELFLKQEDCDVVLKVKGREFSAHRAILRARSSVFASAFRSDMKEKATGVIDIEDCDPSSFSDFLCFLYCGNAEDISTTNVFGLFIAADKYDVQDLRSECLKFMKSNLSVHTFCDTIALALRHSEKTLIDLATDFFTENLQEIIKTVKWQTFLMENPIQSNELFIKALENKKIV